MYFSGKYIKDIIVDEPSREAIEINSTLFYSLLDNNEKSTRILLDIPLLKIRDYRGKKKQVIKSLVPQSDADVFSDDMPFMPALAYITNAMMNAKFTGLSIDEFKDNYLSPFDKTIKESRIQHAPCLNPVFPYPLTHDWDDEFYVHKYFRQDICGSIECIYHSIYDSYHIFGYPPIVRAPLNQNQKLRPDIMHYKRNNSEPYADSPALCFGIGDYKTENYYLSQGFEELKVAIENARSSMIKFNFPEREWSPRVVFALTLRKHLYQAFLCGTDRVFISDHQSFSGFFRYEIVNGQMTIEYYIISDPETVLEGMTLRSAIAGFFYKSEEEAFDTKKALASSLLVAHNAKRFDPFLNVLPRPVEILNKLSTSELQKLRNIEETDVLEDFQVILDQPYWRIMWDAAKWYPNLGLELPYTVVAKLYRYSKLFWEDDANDLLWVSLPDENEYYEMFITELSINEKIAKSQFAANFPKLIVSGYWNGLPDHPMHIFEDVGEEIPRNEWKEEKVYEGVKLRLKELHQLGICHNDVRMGNIHVSESGKILLANFGLSQYPANEKSKMNDFDFLNSIFSDHTDIEDNDSEYGMTMNMNEDNSN